MAGFKGRLSGSLQLQLSVRLSLAIICAALAAAIFAFVSAFAEAHELQDDMLRRIAVLFDQRYAAATLGDEMATDIGDPETRVFVRFLPAAASQPPGIAAGSTPSLPNDLQEGMQTVSAGGETYRVAVRTLGTGQRVAIAQDTAARDEIARNSALRTVIAFLALMPVLLLIVAHLTRRVFRPVGDLGAAIDRRGGLEPRQIATDSLPDEIRPFVAAINRLMGRLDQSMTAQRRFIADAAHELRSPLTALSLQAERLGQMNLPPPARDQLARLRQGIGRGIVLVTQLLALSRSQISEIAPAGQVSARAVFRRVLEDLLPFAEARGIDAGAVDGPDANISASEADLTVIVKNLVDNAIRYTPRGGRVDLTVSDEGGDTILSVEDNGPGIPAKERERVFDPFHRIAGETETGAGLGLSIVRTLAERLGARVELSSPADSPRPGLRVRVIFAAPHR